MSPVSCYFHCHHCTGKICPDGAAGAKVTEVKQTLLVGVCECERPVYFEHERYTYNRQTEVNVCTLILCRSTALKEKKKNQGYFTKRCDKSALWLQITQPASIVLISLPPEKMLVTSWHKKLLRFSMSGLLF